MADQIGGASGNATAADLLTGFTASVASGPISGTMPNNGAVTLTPSGTGTVAIPAGYHNGTGVVSQVSVPAASVLATATIAGVTGTIPSVGANTVTPGTTTKVAISSGTYASGTIGVAGDANLSAANILSGISIFGVAGNVTPKKFASGSASSGAGRITVSGLTFQPKVIIALQQSAASWPAYYPLVYDYDALPGHYMETNGNGGASSDSTLTEGGSSGNYVNSTGFSLSTYPSIPYNWYAYA